MRFRTLDIEGFQSYLEAETVDLTGVNLAAIVGANGSGKSSLLNAVEWALHGRFRGDVAVSLVARGAERAQVTLTFDLNDTTYRVQRTRTVGGRHEVMVSVSDTDGWRDLTEKNPSVADPFLVDLLGMDSTTTRATWMIAQGDFDSFCRAQPAARRAVLAAAFNLDVYASLAAKAEHAQRVAAGDVDAAQRALDDMVARRDAPLPVGPFNGLTDKELIAEAEKAGTEADEATTALASLGAAEVSAAVSTAKDRLGAFRAAHDASMAAWQATRDRAVAQVQHLKVALDAAQAAATVAEDAKWSIADVKAKAVAAQETLESAQRARDNARVALNTLAEQGRSGATRQATLGEQIEQLAHRKVGLKATDSRCFTCQQPLSPDALHDLRTMVEHEHAEAISGRDQLAHTLTQLRSQHTELTKAATLAERAVDEAAKQVAVAEQAVVAVEAAAAVLPVKEADRDTAKAAYEAAVAAVPTDAPVVDEETHAALLEALAAAEAAAGDTAALSARRDELKAVRDAARARERAAWSEQDARARRVETVEALAEPIAVAEKELARVEGVRSGFSTLVSAFRPSGIPAMILAGVVQEINDEANVILDSIGGGLLVEVSTRREKAKGGAEEKVMVYVVTDDGPVDYSTLSGSEQLRVALAIRVALCRCIARRTGTPIETIVLDEGWGALDEHYKRTLTAMLTDLSRDFAILTVSHVEDVKESFPTVIEVSKDSGTSRVAVR